MSPSCTLYNLVKIRKLFRYMKCKRKKWDCEEGGGGGCFQRSKVCVACPTEMKLKGNRKVSWWGVNGISAGIQEMERARKGEAILLNDVWHSAVMDFGCFSS